MVFKEIIPAHSENYRNSKIQNAQLLTVKTGGFHWTLKGLKT
jgi:hypothetical protein